MTPKKKLPFLSVDALLAIPEAKSDVIEVPEWGCSIMVKPLSKGQQIAVRKQAVKGSNIDERLLEGLIFISGVVDPDTGAPLFEKHHIDTLFKKESGVIDRILGQIMQVSGMADGAVDSAEEDMKS